MILDALGNEIAKGDIVLRAKHSAFAIHRVIRITNKNLVLSVRRQSRSWTDWNGVEQQYEHVVDTNTLDSLTTHNSKLYYNKWYTKSGLIKIR